MDHGKIFVIMNSYKKERCEMELELYLLSPYEEYTKLHLCRKHWNYQWRGRKGSFFVENKIIRLRREIFGGLLQAVDGKIYKLDDTGYEFVKQYESGIPIQEICENLNVPIPEGKEFAERLKALGA